MQNLIENISDDLRQFRCIRPNREAIRAVLNKLKITDGYNFGKHYGFKKPFEKFAVDYRGYVLTGSFAHLNNN